MLRLCSMIVAAICTLAAMSPLAVASSSDVQTRIIGGADALPGSWPSFASLTIFVPNEGWYMCGGTLITPTVVLTAAHCVAGASAQNSVVSIGGTAQDASPPVIAWSTYKAHPKFSKSTLQYDVALITLASPSTATPMPLISPEQDANLAVPAQLDVAGFGLTSNGGATSNTLREVNIPFVSDAACQSAYTGAGFNNYSTATMICAGGLGKDSCNGDSGGPLTLTIAGTRTLVGDVSWGPDSGCAAPVLPGVYGRIAAFRPWIAATLATPTIVAVTSAGSTVTVKWSHASADPTNVPLTFAVKESSTSVTTDATATQADLTITSGGPKSITVSSVSGGYSQVAYWSGTPIPTRVPTISARLIGDATVGKALTVDSTTDDPWADAATYQWTSGGTAIAGATAVTYVPSAVDVGAALGVIVSSRNGAGTSTATLAAPAPTAMKPTFTTTRIAVRGTPRVGKVLRVARPATQGYPTPQSLYQWLRNGRVLAGKTRSFYKVTARDRGRHLGCRITLTNSLGSARIRSATVTIR